MARGLWLLWRLLLFSALLASPVPLAVPAGLLRLGDALRALRAAGTRAIGPDHTETPYPFGPGDGERLRPDFQARHGPMGSLLVQQLGDHGLGQRQQPNPKVYLTPPAVVAASH